MQSKSFLKKTNSQNYPKEIQFLRRILLKGDFTEAVRFLWTFQNKLALKQLKKLTLQIFKQKLFELLQNPNKTDLQNLFEKQIVDYCSEEEYQNLFNLLACNSAQEIDGLQCWTPIKGRFQCFKSIQPYLRPFFTDDDSKGQKQNDQFQNISLQQMIESYLHQQKDSEKAQRQTNQNRQFVEYPHTSGMEKSKYKQPNQSKINISVAQSKQFRQKQTLRNSNNLEKDNKNMTNKSTISNKSQRTFEQQMKIKNRQEVQGLEMSESRLEESKVYQKEQRSNGSMGNSREVQQMQASTFSKKNNPYMNLSGNEYNQSRVSNKYNYHPEPLTIEDYQEQKNQHSSNASKLYEKQQPFQKSTAKNLSSYSHNQEPVKKNRQDSDFFQEEVRRNIAYLEQNNSYTTSKEQQNENFTFSNGAEESEINLQEKMRHILKLCSFNDPKAIRACQFSPSGSLFALGSNSSYLRIYDLERMLEQNQPYELNPLCQIPQLHSKSIFCLQWSKNEKNIITCSNDLTIKITEFGDHYSNHKTNVIGRHESCIRMVKFGSQDNRIVSCGDDSLIKIWDIGKIKTCVSLKGHSQSISAVKFGQRQNMSIDDNILFSVSKDCTIRKWDLRTNDCVAVSETQHSEVTYISNNTKDKIVVGHKNGCIGWFNDSLQFEHSLQVHQQQIRSIDGTNIQNQNMLLTSSFDGYVGILATNNPQQPIYHQHNQQPNDKVVFATWLNSQKYCGFASTSTLGICNVFSYL